VLATADGCGTTEIMQRTGKSKPCVWRWQERYVEEGVDGLLRDKTRPPGKKPLPAAIKHKVLTRTANGTPVNATHWSRASIKRNWSEFHSCCVTRTLHCLARTIVRRHQSAGSLRWQERTWSTPYISPDLRPGAGPPLTVTLRKLL
jgi:hypothetical protein